MFKLISVKHQSSVVFLAVALVSILCLVQSVSAQDEPEDIEEADLEAVDYEDLAVEQPPVEWRCRYNCNNSPYSPLCGSDRRTYGNICHLNTTNRLENTRIRKINDGTCPHQRCVPDRHPITCFCEKCPFSRVHCFATGFPDRPITCNDTPTRHDRLVCGTDGVNYQNPCQLVFRTACLGYPVRVCHKGPCRPTNDEDETAGIVDYDE